MPHVNVNGMNLFYEATGPERAPPIVFAHSVGCSLAIWDAQATALEGRYRCIRYDVRSHGQSEAVDRAIEIDDLATDLLGLLDALQVERAHIVGLSLGGMLGQAFAVAHPERLKSLTLISTTAHMPPREFWQTRADTVRADGMAAVVDAVIPRWFTAPFAERQPAVIETFRERFIATDPGGYARCCEAIARMDLREQVTAIAAPTQIIVGADDPATPPTMAEDLRARIAGAEMIVVSNASHIISVERPDIVSAHLQSFLDQHEPDAPSHAFAAGLQNRGAVLGGAHVERSLDTAGAFGMPWQDFITRYAWAEVWGDPRLPWKTRSMLTLAMMIALHREEEFKLHVRPALKNGVSVDELQSLIKQAAVYAGVPAANAAMRWVRDVLGEELE